MGSATSTPTSRSLRSSGGGALGSTDRAGTGVYRAQQTLEGLPHASGKTVPPRRKQISTELTQESPSARQGLKLGLMLEAAGDSALEDPSERRLDSSSCDSEGGATHAANAPAIDKSHVLPTTVRNNFVMGRELREREERRKPHDSRITMRGGCRSLAFMFSRMRMQLWAMTIWWTSSSIASSHAPRPRGTARILDWIE